MAHRLQEPVPLDRRLETKRRLAAIPEIEPDTAKLIYDAMVKVADRTTEANKLLESKANGVIALSSALLGFGVNAANVHHVGHWPIAVCAIVSLLLALGCGFRAALVGTSNLPSPAYYNLQSIAADPGNAAKIALELAEAWHRHTVDERAVETTKSAWLHRAVWLMACGLLAFGAIAVDAVIATDVSAARRTVVH